MTGVRAGQPVTHMRSTNSKTQPHPINSQDIFDPTFFSCSKSCFALSDICHNREENSFCFMPTLSSNTLKHATIQNDQLPFENILASVQAELNRQHLWYNLDILVQHHNNMGYRKAHTC